MSEENKKIIDIDEKRESRFMIFDNLKEEKNWFDRVEKECLKECLEKEKK